MRARPPTPPPAAADPDEPEEPAPVEIPIDGVLDLHTFAPAEVKSLVPEYLDECGRRGILHVRIIHGKGQGVLRRIVHAALERHPRVLRYALADGSGGSWGATVVELKAG
jgi:DNA-nicking Smr family endonuclease